MHFYSTVISLSKLKQAWFNSLVIVHRLAATLYEPQGQTDYRMNGVD